MKIKIYFLAIAFFSVGTLNAQQFLNKAIIEFEVTSNIKKTMGNGTWAEMIKDNLPTFKIGYYNFTFVDNKSTFKFDHWDPKVKIPEYLRKSDEENIWYYDYNTDRFNIKKNIYGSDFIIEDSIKNLSWKLTNENRVIAGFNCRKAVAVMFDSVYVFAFYTDEILIPGGPCAINGLPGMILGVTIPRLFTSWIATKVTVQGVNEAAIKPIAAKKPLTSKSFQQFLNERLKDWYSEDEEDKQQKDRFIWSTLL